MNQQTQRTLWRSLLIWSVAALLQASVLLAQQRLYFPYALGSAAIYYGLLALVAVPVWRICLRLSERPLKVAVPLHIGVGVVAVILWQGANLAIMAPLAGGLANLGLEVTGLWQLLSAFTIYAVMVAGFIAVQTSRKLAEQTRRAAELRLLAREAEIRALKLLIRPHFFFNVLNSIYSLIESRPRAAQEMVEQVADLMRQTMEASDDDFVPLEWELRAVETYLRIEKVRMGDRLTVRFDRDGAAPDCAVPPFLLQPLVENAIKHGIAPKPGPGEVVVGVRASGEQIELTVRDTGDGFREREPHEERDGHGLSIVRQRLENLYGAAFSIAHRNLAGGGFEVAISIPARSTAHA
ncbi:MAG TPA: histidine kinase [Candidatus Solibacter sp.]|nr:histidine kinase [Candidatus Solibacter sp.]